MFLFCLIFYQIKILTAINNTIVNDKQTSNICKFCIFQAIFFSLKFLGLVFISPIISSHLITVSLLILSKYFSFSQLDLAGLQNIIYFYIYYVFSSHIGIYRYSTTDLSYIFFHQVYIYIRMIYLLLNFWFIFPVIILKTCI